MASNAPDTRRKPARRWRGAATLVIALLLVLFAGLVWLFNTERGTQFALSSVQSLSNGVVQIQGVDGTLNGPLHLDDLTFTLTGQKIVLNDVRLDWRPSALLYGRLHIASLNIARLDLVSKISQTSEPARLPDNIALPVKLQIDRLQVAGGNIAWGPMNVITLGGFAFNLDFDGQRYLLNLDRLNASSQSGANAFSGTFNGNATLSATKPYALNASLTSESNAVVNEQKLGADGRINLQGSLAEINSAIDMHINQASLKGNAVLRPFSDSPLGAANLKTDRLNLAELAAGLPTTALNIDLHANDQGTGKLTLNNTDAGLYNDGKLPVDRLEVGFTQPNAQFNIERIVADLGTARRPAGRISGNGNYANGALVMTLKTDALDLQKLDQRVRATRLTGNVELRHADGKQAFTVALSEPLKKNPLTLNAHAVIADDAMTIDRATLRAGDSMLDASALIAFSGKQQFNAKGTMRSLRLRDFGDFSQGSTQLPELFINGEFSVSGARQPALEADVAFRIDDSRIANNSLSGEGQAQLRANSLIVSKLSLRAGSNNLTAQGKLAESDSRITFALTAPALEQLGAGFVGALQVNGEVRGSVQQPRIVADWHGSKIHAPGKIQIDSTQGKVDVVLDRRTALLIADANLTASANGLRSDTQQLASMSAQVNLAAQPSAPLSVAIRADGIDGAQLRAQSFGLDVSGTTAHHTLTATLAEGEQNWKMVAVGGMQNLQRAPQWQGAINTLDASGRFNAKLAAPAPLLMSQRMVQLDQFKLNADNAIVSIDQFLRNDNAISTRGRFEHLQVGKLLPLFQSQPSISADLMLGGEWNLKLANNLDGTFAVRRESGDAVMLGNAPVALGLSTLTASADASNGRVALKFLAEGKQLGRIDIGLNTTIGGGDTRFSIASNAPLNGSAQINTPTLSWLGPLVSQTLVTEGSVQGNIALNGTFGNPRFSGQIAADKLRLFFTDTGVDLKQGTLRSEFQGDRLIVKTLNFQNDGTLDISGPISLVGQQLALELAIKATRYKLIDRSDRKIVASGDSVVGWRNNGLKANGKFTIDSGMVDIGTADTPELSDDVVVLGQTVKQGTKTAIALDLEIDLGKGIHLSGRGIDAKLVGQLRLLANAGDALRAEGTLRVASGTFKAYGRELTIERGLLRFNGALNNPSLDILAMRKGQEVEAGVQVGGTVLIPRVTLVSDPVVADAEKLSWLVLGRGLSTAGGSDVGALQTAASSLLAQGAAAGLSSQLATAFGLDDFSVGTSDTNLQERIVTLGKKISSRLYVSYQQGLQSASSVLLLRYTLTPRISIEAEAGTRSALSMFYSFAFD